jgi:hypothetical protein
MGLIVKVYRSKHDATNGGLSSKYDDICIVNIDGPFKPSEDAAAFVLLEGPLGDPTLYPVLEVGDGAYQQAKPQGFVGPMFGGNYAASSDGRFRDAVGFYGAVPIHDRFDSPQLAERLSQ